MLRMLPPCSRPLTSVSASHQVRGRSLSTSANPRVEHKQVTRTNSDQRAVRRKSAGQERAESAAEAGRQRLFIDQVLERHARRLLCRRRLRLLASFAAHMEFHLVEWLRRERWRAALVDDLVAGLRQLHHDFQWPYPVPPQPLGFFLAAAETGSGSGSGSGAVSANGTAGQLQERLRALHVHTGEGGDRSAPPPPPPPVVPAETPSPVTQDARLLPHLVKGEAPRWVALGAVWGWCGSVLEIGSSESLDELSPCGLHNIIR